jgi:hypothetical protein
MPWGAVAGAAVGLIGSSMQADAAGDAAAGQQQASQEANMLQRYMFDRNTELQMPTINTGNSARDRLSYLLGLSPNGFSGNINGAPKLSYDQLRAQLVGQYTKQPTADAANAAPVYRTGQEAVRALGEAGAAKYFQDRSTQNPPDRYGNGVWSEAGTGPGYWGKEIGTTGSREWVRTDGTQATGPASVIDETALDAAIKARLAEQDAAQRALEEAAKNDPNYGRLSQQFEFDKYTPEKFSYTGEDLFKDPSYQFRLQQGQKALDRQGAAAGRFLSGAQLQASSDYNQGAASQEFQSAYQRALGTFGTNEANRFNAFSTNEGNRFNAYQANFNNAVNPLLALSGAATLGSQNLGSAGASVANQMGQNITSNANAQGAAGIASANSIAGGLNNAYSGYQQNQLMNSLMNNRGGSVNNNPGAWNTNATNWAFGTGGMGD